LRMRFALCLCVISVLSVNAVSVHKELLNFINSCASQYSSISQCPQTYRLDLIHPARSLSCLVENSALLTGQCQTDVLAHSFSACAGTSMDVCNRTLVDPGVQWDEDQVEPWPIQQTPFQEATDCLIGNSQRQLSSANASCLAWLNGSAVFQCQLEVPMQGCSRQDPMDTIDCLISKLPNMKNSMCDILISNYPSNFSNQDLDVQRQFTESFYSLISNPNGQPTMPPALFRDRQPDQNQDQRNMGVIGVVVMVLAMVAMMAMGIFMYYRRKRQLKDQPYKFDEPTVTKGKHPETETVVVR